METPAATAATGWDRTVDVLVIGGGAGGLAAALAASIESLDVLLAEKTGQVGGTASTSAGSLWIPGNRHGAEAGYADDPQDALEYLRGLQGAGANSASMDAYLRLGPSVIEYFERNSEVRFATAGHHPDYRDLPGAAKAGRVIVPLPFDGRRLGQCFARVRPPIEEFLLFGGMMVGKVDLPPLVNRFRSVGNFLYAAGLLTRYLVDRLRFPRGTRLMMGNALVARMFHSLLQRRVPILFETPMERLHTEAGTVVGATLGTASGDSIRVRALRGVVLATGGIGHHASLRDELMAAPAPARSLAAPGNTGDGITSARRIGARVDREADNPGGFWTPVSLPPRRSGAQGLFPHLLLDRAKPGLIAVDGAGRRFVNEADSYHDFVNAMLASKAVPCWLVCTGDFIRQYGLGLIYPGTTRLDPHTRTGYLKTADTVEELAQRMGLDARELQRSISQMNAAAQTGVDEWFAKGSTELNRTNGDAAVQPNPCLGPISTPPYCAMQVWPAEIASSAGLAADEHGRVLDLQGDPVPGLYVCGNDRGSIFGGTYPGPGTTLGPALVFAWRAAMHLAGHPA